MTLKCYLKEKQNVNLVETCNYLFFANISLTSFNWLISVNQFQFILMCLSSLEHGQNMP